MGSQFFIVYKDSPIPSDSAGGYTVLGRITSGLETISNIAADGVSGDGTDGAPKTAAVIKSITVK
jgi:peptidyl-prolyl cis-trans isomerase B (cyclophilin B)